MGLVSLDREWEVELDVEVVEAEEEYLWRGEGEGLLLAVLWVRDGDVIVL